MDQPLFEKVADGIKFDWKFSDIVSQFSEDVFRDKDIPTSMFDDSGKAYFQVFYSSVGTSTNFGSIFPDQAQDVCNKVCHIREVVRSEVEAGKRPLTPYIQMLLDCVPRRRDVLFLKAKPGVGADPHLDHRRKIVLNIGFENSCTATTFAKPGYDLEGFYDDYSKLKAFTLNDGDAYIMDVNQAHAVKSLVPAESGLYRYIISYPLIK